MFYYSIESRSKVVHYEGCHHLKKIKKENLKSSDNIHALRQSSYGICSCCSPIARHLRSERAQLEQLCQENGLSYSLKKDALHVNTHSSKWKILVSNTGCTFELHHGNSFEGEHNDSVPGYHKQNFFSDSLVGYLDYINSHEYYRMLNPLHIVTPKEPPKKGTRRYRALQKNLAAKERRRKISNVINLIDSISHRACYV